MNAVVASAPVVRLAEPTDFPGLVRLFGRHYAQFKPEAYFAWQFFSPSAPAALAVAVDGSGEVVGSFGFMRRPLTDGRWAGQVMDILLDTDQRGKGVFDRLAHLAFSAFPDVALRLVLSNAAGTGALLRRPGWRAVARVPVFLADLSADTPAAAGLSDAPSPAPPLAIAYDEAWERWRFDAHPFNRYHRLDEAGVRGYLKLFVDPKDSSRRAGDILLVSPASPAATHAWLRAAREWFRAQAVPRCGLWALPGTPAAQAAVAAGFLPREQERWLCAQVVDNSGAFRLEDAAWDVRAADAEFY